MPYTILHRGQKTQRPWGWEIQFVVKDDTTGQHYSDVTDIDKNDGVASLLAKLRKRLIRTQLKDALGVVE